MKSGGDMKRPSRIRLPSREELALWRHATADVRQNVKKPLHRSKMDLPAAPGSTSEPAGGDAKISARPAVATARRESKQPDPPTLAPLAPMDRRLKKALSSGKARADDVIDLHGMSQAQAHQALNSFLWRASASGARVVLVITGKGNPRDAAGSDYGGGGVLRRCAPQWLRAPALRSIVLSVEEAGRAHGGSGALYVRMRRLASSTRKA